MHPNRSWKPERQTLTFCTIAKNEDQFLYEWVAFHYAAGVDHFLIIADGKNGLNFDLVRPFIDAGIVTPVYFHGSSNKQREAFNRAIYLLKRKTVWIGFFDVDEFVFPTQKDCLTCFLEDFSSHPGVAVNWVSFGSGGRESPAEGWVTETFLERGPLNHQVDIPHLRVYDDNGDFTVRPMNTHVKCFVKASEVEFFRSAHHFKYSKNQVAVDEKLRPVASPFSSSVSIEKIRVNHYWSKSLSDLELKLGKGRISQNSASALRPYDTDLARAREKASRGVHDTDILPHVNDAKSLLLRLPSATFSTKRVKVFRLRFPPIRWLFSRLRFYKKAVRRFRRRLK